MKKKCCYCLRVYAGDEEPSGSGARDSFSGLWAFGGRRRENLISHGVCADCFENRKAEIDLIAGQTALAVYSSAGASLNRASASA